MTLLSSRSFSSHMGEREWQSKWTRWLVGLQQPANRVTATANQSEELGLKDHREGTLNENAVMVVGFVLQFYIGGDIIYILGFKNYIIIIIIVRSFLRLFFDLKEHKSIWFREKRRYTIQHGYRKWVTHARVFSQTLAHGNSKNEIW